MVTGTRARAAVLFAFFLAAVAAGESTDYRVAKRGLLGDLSLLPGDEPIHFVRRVEIGAKATITKSEDRTARDVTRYVSGREMPLHELHGLQRTVSSVLRASKGINANAQEQIPAIEGDARRLASSFRRLEMRETDASRRASIEKLSFDFNELARAVGGFSSLEELAIARRRVSDGQDKLEGLLKVYVDAVYTSAPGSLTPHAVRSRAPVDAHAGD